MSGVPLSCGIVFFVLHLIDRVPQGWVGVVVSPNRGDAPQGAEGC